MRHNECYHRSKTIKTLVEGHQISSSKLTACVYIYGVSNERERTFETKEIREMVENH